jgi:DNA polymerase elongation subunit (family B)
MIDGVSIDSLLNTDIANESEFALAANGSRYRRDTRGVMPRLTESMFGKRKAAKDEMLRLKREYEKTHDESFKKASARFGVLQLAVKVQLNSLFGAMANKYFLFFDNRIAEGITTTGQYAIQAVSRRANQFMSKVCKIDMDYVVYNDTDSLCVRFDKLVELAPKKMTDDATATFVLKFIDAFLAKALNESTKEISDRLNFYENKLYFKPEAISSTTVVLAKKRNCQKVLDNEGVRYAQPEYKITGIETNRSSTPDLVREWLTEAIKLILDHADRDILLEYITKCQKNFHSYSVEEIAFPRSANNMREYSDSNSIYAKGCPIAVRAALLYNNLILKNDLTKKYELIKEGDKIKYVALIEPNTLRENIIGFPSELPKEFNLHRYIDYDTQFSKAFLDPLVKIMDAMKWQLEEENSLDDFFG